MTDRLLILKCSDPSRWYAPLVGQIVQCLGRDVEHTPGRVIPIYWSREPQGYRNWIEATDAQLLAGGER